MRNISAELLLIKWLSNSILQTQAWLTAGFCSRHCKVPDFSVMWLVSATHLQKRYSDLFTQRTLKLLGSTILYLYGLSPPGINLFILLNVLFGVIWKDKTLHLTMLYQHIHWSLLWLGFVQVRIWSPDHSS